MFKCFIFSIVWRVLCRYFSFWCVLEERLAGWAKTNVVVLDTHVRLAWCRVVVVPLAGLFDREARWTGTRFGQNRVQGYQSSEDRVGPLVLGQ